MTLGKAGVSGGGPDLFDQPTDVVVAPNGDIFVTDSHRNGKNNRVVKFTKDGKFVKEWGQQGIGPRRVQRAAHDRDGLARPAVRRRPREQPHPDLRSGRHVPRRVAAVRPAERHLHHEGRHDLRRRLRIRPRHRRARADGDQERHPHRQREGRHGHARSSRIMESTTPDHSGAEGVGVDAQGNVYGARRPPPDARASQSESG